MERKNIDNKCSRRVFMKNSGLICLSAAFSGTIISACTKDNPFSVSIDVFIDENNCVGCGDCLDACFYDAIILPEKSLYTINKELCIECGKCMERCPDDAFAIILSRYEIDEQSCVGCGDCIEKCALEGDCIAYEKEYYTVRGRCKPDRCHFECVNICPEDAITINDKASIDVDKCTRCGDCVSECPYDAINPAKVFIEQNDCTRCGECFNICEFDAVSKIKPAGWEAPHVIQERCTSCGDCFDEPAYFDYDAIERKNEVAEIKNSSCRECQNCLDTCKYDAIQINT